MPNCQYQHITRNIFIIIYFYSSNLIILNNNIRKLSEDNKKQLFIPRGFAHGFVVLSDEAIFTYKVDNVYAPQADAGIMFNDPTIAIQWPIDSSKMLLSEKDKKHPQLKDAIVFE